ncbi:hypothetical protein OS187_13990, partial [Xanthomonadaceae bacterium JHOS43]|nr:hypothetical protein [Xanthomonadaceae bacterium JHOS43]
TIQTPYAGGLTATVTDANNAPVQGVSVTFAVPVSGASATFAGSASQVVVTDASGIATSTAPMANATAGAFNVTVTVSGIAPEAVELTNVSGAATALAIVSGD